MADSNNNYQQASSNAVWASIAGATIQGSFNIGAAELTGSYAKKIAQMEAESNERIAQLQLEGVQKQIDAQLAANKQQQEFNKSEAELAFTRNSFAGQLKQLKDAGLSDQQARQYLLGSTSGEYAAAQSVNQMEGVDFSKPYEVQAQQMRANQEAQSRSLQSQASAHSFSLQASGQVISAGLNDLIDSYVDPRGGNLGSIVAAPFMREFTALLPDIDKSTVHNFADCEEWINSLDPNSEKGKMFHAFKNSKAFKAIKTFAPAAKAVNSFMNDIYTSNMTSAQMFEKTKQDIKIGIATESLTTEQTNLAVAQKAYSESLVGKTSAEVEFINQQKAESVKRVNLINQQVLQAKWSQLTAELDYKKYSENYELISDLEKQMYLAQTAEALNKYKLTSDPFYFKLFVQANEASLQGQYVNALLMSYKDATNYNLLRSNPEFNWSTAMFNSLNSCGVMQYMVNDKFYSPFEQSVSRMQKDHLGSKRKRTSGMNNPDNLVIESFTDIP